MASKWLGIFGKDLQRGCVYRLIAVGIAVPLLILFIFVPLYFANLPGLSEQQAVLIMVIPAGIFILLILVGAPALIYYSIRRRAAWLDDVFTSQGLEGRSYALTGRQYHGRLRGRDVDVTFVRGPSLSLKVSSAVQTRLGVSGAGDVSLGLARLFNKEPLDLSGTDLLAFAQEEEWGRALLEDPQVRRLLEELISEDHPFSIRQVEFNPGSVMLRLYRSRQVFDFRISPEQGRRWLNSLFELAEIAEKLPAPRQALTVSELPSDAPTVEPTTTRTSVVMMAVILGIALCLGAVGLILGIWLGGNP